MGSCPRCRSENPDDSYFCRKCGSRLSGVDEASAGTFAPTLSLDVEGKLLQPGTLFAGKYKIKNEIGRGGMGVVFKAQDTHLRRTVALKFLPNELAIRPEAKERFLREARAAAALDHPNICTIYEAEEASGLAFIAMAYVEGRTLADRIDQGALSPDDTLEIALHVADGLTEAHRKGILHRDIKSSNIMLTEKGQAKIMDFGLAKMSGEPVLTKESRTMGTVAYMSPEQARGEEVDARTDVWSLGVVLYEMLAGHLPFRADHEQAIIHGILHENPKPIRKIVPDLPEAFANVVGTALSKDRENRYASAVEILADLQRVKEGLTVTAPRQSPFAGRRKIAWAAGAAGMLLLAAAIFLLNTKISAKVYDKIAVMPFVMSGGGADQDDIEDGLTGELIQRLYQVASLQVKATAAVLPYKKSPKPIKDIGRELGVKALVMSRITRPAGRIRINIELVDAITADVLFTKNYDGDGTDYIVLQSSIAQDLVRSVRAQLPPDEQARLAKSQKIPQEAYEKYLKASRLGVDNPYSKDADEKILALIKEALVLEPNFARPFSLLLMRYFWRWWFAYNSYQEIAGPIKEASDNIIRIDPDSADAWFARSWGFYFEYRWREYLDALSKAVDLAPGDSAIRYLQMNVLLAMGFTDQALAAYRYIEVNDPAFLGEDNNPGLIYIYGRRYDDALATCLGSLKKNPKSCGNLCNMALAYSLKGMHKEALEYSDKMLECLRAEGTPITVFFRSLEIVFLARAGEREKAVVLMHELEKSPDRKVFGKTFDFFMACALAGTGDPGDREEAFRYLEQSTAEPNQSSNGYASEPLLDPLRSDPRFARILQKAGFPF